MLKRKAEQGVKIYVIVYKEVCTDRSPRVAFSLTRRCCVPGHANDVDELEAHQGEVTNTLRYDRYR